MDCDRQLISSAGTSSIYRSGRGFPATFGFGLMSVAFLILSVSPAVSTTFDKWHPGMYVKIEHWQLQNPDEMNRICRELADTPQLRGIKVVIFWGRYEKRDTNTGICRYDFSQIDQILARLSALDDKYLILSVPWREFQPDNGASQVLPDDLQGGHLWNADSSRTHTQYDHLWAYRIGNQPGTYGYNLKLWDPTVLTSTRRVPGRSGDPSRRASAIHANCHHRIRDRRPCDLLGARRWKCAEAARWPTRGDPSMRRHFVQSLVVSALNYDRKHVARMISILEKEGLGLGSPNSNLHHGLITTTAAEAPGVLTYYPRLSGKVVLAPEIQGDKFQSTYGPGSSRDHPGYEYLYRRVRDDLKANYVVVQRKFPFWLGDASKGIPSMLKFIQTYPAIVNDDTRAGGLNHVKPRSVQ